MRSALLFLVAAALLCAVFAFEDSVETDMEYKQKCKKVLYKCVKHTWCKKAKTVCDKWVTTQTSACLLYKVTKKLTKKAFCEEWAPEPRIDVRCGPHVPNHPRKCLKTGVKTITTYNKKCVKRGERKYCHTYKRECDSKETEKVCWRVTVPPTVSGPKKCKKGLVINYTKKGKYIRRHCVKPRAISYKQCSVYLDPHVATFDNQHYNFQVEGDYVVAESDDGIFQVQARYKYLDNQRWSATVAVAVLVNGVDVIELDGRSLYKNGLPYVPLLNSLTDVSGAGGQILMSNDQLIITGSNQNKVSISMFKYGSHDVANLFFNFDKSDNTKGLCAGVPNDVNKVPRAGGLFRKPHLPKYAPGAVAPRKITHAKTSQRNSFRAECLATGCPKRFIRACMLDLVQTSRADHKKIVLDVYRRIEDDMARIRNHFAAPISRIRL